MEIDKLERLSKLIRYWILKMTTEAGSGHVTSSLSAVELMVGLMFGGSFKFRARLAARQVSSCEFENNDRLIFSKGHASPLFYALWASAEQSHVNPDELMSLRRFGSRLEGHPTMKFPFTEAATGSLGQGLSVGVGMALNAKLEGLNYRTYVLLGDSEMAEGSNWEAIQLAAHYRLDNLVGVLDVNRLGQRGETMYGHDLYAYQTRVEAFGWKTIVVDGHEMKQVREAFREAETIKNTPVMIIGKTLKGKGVAFLEAKEGWHGKVLKPEELEVALKELGEVDTTIRGHICHPEPVSGSAESNPKLVSNPKGIPDQVRDDSTLYACSGYQLRTIATNFS